MRAKTDQWPPEMYPQGLQFLIRFPDSSVNRSLFSEASDVLQGIEDFGSYWILSWAVGQIPKTLVAERHGESEFECRPVHVPTEENYAHSEIQTFQKGSAALKEPSRTQKSLFRSALASLALVERNPTEA